MLGKIMSDMGYIRYPLTFSLLVVLALVAWSALKLFGSGPGVSARTKAWLDAILFWGGFALVTGILGTLLGVIQAAQAIELQGGASTPLVWGGIKVALLSSVYGILILTFAGLAWFVLHMRWRTLSAGREAAA